MSKRLSDAEINKLMPYAATEPDFVHSACAQAREANRLRAGMNGLLSYLDRLIADDTTMVYGDEIAAHVRELLEGGE